MISVVCVYNNERVLRDYLLQSLERQTSQYDLILQDSTKGMFKSAAQALNQGGDKAKGKYIMFVHQDVDLHSDSWLEEAEGILDSIPDLGVAGVAGVSEEGRNAKERIKTIIEHGIPPTPIPATPIHKPEKVQTLDECLAIIPKSVFNVLQFDEEVCDNWYYYVTDYCLSCRKLGLEAYVIPMVIRHLSVGSDENKTRLQALLSLGAMPEPYYQTLKKILKKHKKDYKRIYETCGFWSTSYPVILQRIGFLVKAGVNRLFLKGEQ